MMDRRFPLLHKATGAITAASPEGPKTTEGGNFPMRRFAVADLAAGLPSLSVATAPADANTVTISGVAWKDLNGDGIRQPAEQRRRGAADDG
jgi:hypothetical protein